MKDENTAIQHIACMADVHCCKSIRRNLPVTGSVECYVYNKKISWIF